MYEVNGLKEGIERCRINIKTFEDAINKEHDTITEYERMIKVLEEQSKNGDSSRSYK